MGNKDLIHKELGITYSKKRLYGFNWEESKEPPEECANDGKTMKRIIILIVACLLVVVIAACFVMYKSITKYMDTHTWATIRITGTVDSETTEAFYEDREFLKYDTYSLHNTTFIIEDITHDGEVTIKFEPEVNNSDTGELISVAIIDKNDVLNIKEVCSNGDSATWQLRVISNRYQ